MLKEYKFKTDNQEKEWDNYLLEFRDYHIFQSFLYGEYFRVIRQGAKIKRFIQLNSLKPQIMAQVLIKEFKPLSSALISIKGGPLFQTSDDPEANIRELKKFLKDFIEEIKSKYKLFYINIQINTPATVSSKLLLRELGWRKPLFERYSFLTYIVPLSQEPEENLRAFNKKWRNQLRRAEKENHKFSWGNDQKLIERYVKIHEVMCQEKGKDNLKIKASDLLLLKRYLGNHIKIMVGSLNDQDVCGCVVLLFKEKSYYLYATSTSEAREVYSANLMIWEILKKLKENKVGELDLFGVDPERNWGGYHFKQGVGGEAVEFLGEWEYFSSNFLKIPLNTLLYLRNKFLN